jgi:hypothetical protein
MINLAINDKATQGCHPMPPLTNRLPIMEVSLMSKKIIPKYPSKVKIEKHMLEELYLEKGLSQRECGDVFGVSQTCISNHLKKNGIKTKPYASYGFGVGEKNNFYGKKHSTATIKKLKKHAKNRFAVPENNPMYGRTHTKEAREKIAEGHRGVPLSDEHKKKVSLAGLGRVKSEETRKKLSVAINKRIAFGEDHWCWRGGNEATLKRRYEKISKTPSLKLNSAISRGIYEGLRKNKSGIHWEKLVGYTIYDLMDHIEKQFQPGMSWDNYGRMGWHIDHKIPKSAFNFITYDDLDFRRCWALENLQPMWWRENICKGAKLETPFQPSFAFGGAL